MHSAEQWSVNQVRWIIQYVNQHKSDAELSEYNQVRWVCPNRFGSQLIHFSEPKLKLGVMFENVWNQATYVCIWVWEKGWMCVSHGDLTGLVLPLSSSDGYTLFSTGCHTVKRFLELPLLWHSAALRRASPQSKELVHRVISSYSESSH